MCCKDRFAYPPLACLPAPETPKSKSGVSHRHCSKAHGHFLPSKKCNSQSRETLHTLPAMDVSLEELMAELQSTQEQKSVVSTPASSLCTKK